MIIIYRRIWLVLGTFACLLCCCFHLTACTMVGCDAVCGKQFSCYQGKLDRDACLRSCQNDVNAGKFCQQYYNCWNNATCEQIANCVDAKALCP